MIEESSVTRGWYSTEYSKRLSGRQRKNTKPEMLLRRAIHALGGRYRLHRRVAPRISADVAFPKEKVAIFVDGCFWHGCPVHGKRQFMGPNAHNWEMKIKRNQERDRRVVRQAGSEGWEVIRLWECEVIDNPAAVARRIMSRVRLG